MTDLKSNTVLQGLLDANRRFDLNGRGTTNHCPMALSALAAMGAPPQRLEQFFARWEERYALTGSDHVSLSRAAWPEAIGQGDLFCAARDCFADWVAQDGADVVLQEVIGKLSLAPASGAFHALIRLAYGLETGNDGEIGAGLAALACGRLAIDIPLKGRAAAASVQDGLALLAQWLPDARIGDGWITPRLRAVAQLPTFRAVLPAPPQEEDLLAGLRTAALTLHWQTDDFVALHTVTGMHAARIVLSHLPRTMAQRYLPELWTAFCTAYVVVGAPPLLALPALPMQEDWPSLFVQAVASDDDHDIKLAYSCFEENRLSPSPVYYAAARRRLAARQARAA
ncbi:MAG TPA: questin oxidase family protein [Burkholderiaceae bacterium]